VHSIFSLPQSSKRGSLASLFTQYSGDAQVQEVIRFNCPTCYTSCGRPNDLLKHLKDCERADEARYRCHNCQHEAESTIDMDRHCINAKTLDPQHNLGSVEVHVQVKFGFGYPYCCHYFPTTDHPTYDECLVAYHAHIVCHARGGKAAPQASRSKRVLASIRGNLEIRTTEGLRSILELVEFECQRQHLPRGACWRFQWDDDKYAKTLWQCLENGQRDDSHLMGGIDVGTFFSDLVRKGHHFETDASALHPLTNSQDLTASVQAGGEDQAPFSFDVELFERQLEAETHGADAESSYLAPPTSAMVPDHKRKRSLSDTAWLSQHLNPIAAAKQRNCDKPLPLLPTLYEEHTSQVHNEAPFMSNAGWAHNGSIYSTNEGVPTTAYPAAFPPYWPPATYPF